MDQIYSIIDNHYSLDSEVDFRSGCRNVSLSRKITQYELIVVFIIIIIIVIIIIVIAIIIVIIIVIVKAR